MGDLMILNGSPRAPRSNSKRYAELFSSYYPGSTQTFPITRNNHQELCARIDGASRLLLGSLEAYSPRQKPTVSVLVNCGFLEPRQNEVAVRMLRLYCRRNGYPFGSVLMIGSGEAILDSPFRFLAARKIQRFARAVAREDCGTFQITMPLTKGIFVRAAASYWERYGKRYGITKEQMQTMDIEP